MTSDANEIVSIGQVTIPFYEDDVIVHLGEDGEIYVAVRPIVEALGLDWSAQYRRINRDAVLGEVGKNIRVAVTATRIDQGHGAREFLCLPKQYVSGFLFGINANRVREDLRENLILWQKEAHLFLDAALTGDVDSAVSAIWMKYKRLGYDEAWIKQRQITIATRKELTQEWDMRGIRGQQYGILTAVVHRGAFGINPSEHKERKGIKKGDVRDHMNGLELAFINLAEQATIDTVRQEDSLGYQQNYDAAQRGGEAAGKAREAFEEEHGRRVISSKSYLEERKRLGDGENGA